MPPRENMSSKIIPDVDGETVEDPQLVLKELECQANATDACSSLRSLELDEKHTTADSNDFLVETKTGFKFPVLLFPSLCKGSDDGGDAQVLAGVGLRSISIIKLKNIKIYAFGFYIKPDNLRLHLGSKYGAVPPEELKLKSSFYDDLLRHELNMSLRLIVHYKRVKVGMVRSAFESSLKNRLRKLKGVDDDEGLRVFCSYFTEDLCLPQGTIIDFNWLPGGQFQTKVGDRVMGTIFSLDFCRAFFHLYIGDPPVCSNAKQAIGLQLGHMLCNGPVSTATT